MEDKSNKKIMTVSFVIVAAVVAIVMNVLLDSLAATIGAVARFRSMDIVAHGLPVGAGIITFLYLQFNSKVLAWADEVVVEIRKVVWPSRRDTSAMTIVTCIMLIVSATFLGVFDFVSRNLIKIFIN